MSNEYFNWGNQNEAQRKFEEQMLYEQAAKTARIRAMQGGAGVGGGSILHQTSIDSDLVVEVAIVADYGSGPEEIYSQFNLFKYDGDNPVLGRIDYQDIRREPDTTWYSTKLAFNQENNKWEFTQYFSLGGITNSLVSATSDSLYGMYTKTAELDPTISIEVVNAEPSFPTFLIQLTKDNAVKYEGTTFVRSESIITGDRTLFITHYDDTEQFVLQYNGGFPQIITVPEPNRNNYQVLFNQSWELDDGHTLTIEPLRQPDLILPESAEPFFS